MSPSEVAQHIRNRLAAELREEIDAVSALLAQVERLAAPAADTKDEWIRAGALAFGLERLYTAVEAALVRVLSTLDENVPDGPSSHLEILRAASVAVTGLRTAIIDRATRDDLQELLRFRHFARHAYADTPELARLDIVVTHARRGGRSVVASLTRFADDLLAG